MTAETVRPFHLDRDMDDAHRVFVSAFHHLFYPIMDEADPALCRDMIRICAVLGNRSFAVEADGRVIGMLLGTVRPRLKHLAAASSQTFLRFTPRAAFNRYRMSGFARRHLHRLFIGYSPHLYKHPPNWPLAEIIVFAVHRDFHGLGLGRRLMEAFLQEAAGSGAARATVSTDTEMSWHFYPAFGFQRVVTFPLKAYRLILPESRPEGYIYAIDTKELRVPSTAVPTRRNVRDWAR